MQQSMPQRRGSNNSDVALFSLAAAISRAVAGYRAGRTPSADCAGQCIKAICTYKDKLRLGSASTSEAASALLLSNVCGSLLQLLALSSLPCCDRKQQARPDVHQLPCRAHYLFLRAIAILEGTPKGRVLVPALAAAERVSVELIRMGFLRPCSRILEQGAAVLQRLMEPGGAPATLSSAQLVARWRPAASDLHRAGDYIHNATLFLGVFLDHMQRELDATAGGAAAAARGGTGAGTAGAEATVAQRRARGRQLYWLLVSELCDSQMLEHGSRVVLLVRASGVGEQGPLVQQGNDPVQIHAKNLLVSLYTVTGVYYRSGGSPADAPDPPGSRPDVPRPPWGRCTQYLTAAFAVRALAAAGFGGGPSGGGSSNRGGSGCGGAGGAGGGNGSSSAYGLARGLPDYLPIATVADANMLQRQGIESAAERASLSVRFLAQETFHVFLFMVEEQLWGAAGLPPAVGAEPLLPAEYWEAVVRLLRVDAAPKEAPMEGPTACANLTERLLQMLVVPDMAGTASLEPAAQPSASVAVAFSSGLVAGLERCVRFLGRSADPDEAGATGSMILAALGRQPSGLPHLLAFGPPDQVASLVTTLAKMLQRSVDRAAEAAEEAGSADWAAQAAYRHSPQQPVAGRDCGGQRGAEGSIETLLEYGLDVEPVRSATCRIMVVHLSNVCVALSTLMNDPRVAAVALDGPHAARPQLRQLLSILLQRWLPPLTRAMLLAPRLPGPNRRSLGYASLLLRCGASTLLSAVSPERLESLRAAAASINHRDANASVAEVAAAVARGSASTAASARPESAAAPAPLPAASSSAAAADSWRRWLRSGGGSPLPVLGMVLGYLVGLTFGDERSLTTFLDWLLAAAVAEPEALKAEMRAAANASAGGGDSSSGAGPAPPALNEPGLLRAWWANMCSLELVRSDPRLCEYAIRVLYGVECLCDGDDGHFAALALQALQQSNGDRQLCRWAAALLPPAEAGAGLPPACSNPRCVNMAGDSDADLAAAGGDGMRRCGGCGSARYCSVECQRAHWRTGHRAECGGRAGGAQRGGN
ncbi:hypothetical protein GPECTOR_46g291 [Gonium pectorale]|uniref:phytol kinase n=1 Tax=Gonium pectorale TaxID=33097 RepID=A0A150G8P7_GONPE|nr:hypothetical protein GPECTOR_46g291 [Gonium pectorale]|eukprot:KXZ46222.1 hypothetical protein GPECTOR_46g291 [Gonium pectorale]